MTDPEDFAIPTIAELDAMREAYGLSQAEFSRRAGMETTRWGYIVRGDVDPRLSTVRAFLDVLHEADPDGPRVERGQPPGEGEEKTHATLAARLEAIGKRRSAERLQGAGQHG